MVAKRIVDSAFWEDGYIMDELNSDEKYFLLYLMTNTRSTQVGIYGLPKRVMAFESGLKPGLIEEMLVRFVDVHKLIAYDHTTQEVTILGSLKHSILKGGQPVIDCLNRELRLIKQPELVLATYHHMKTFWTRSQRDFDQTIMGLFEDYLIRCELLENESKNKSNNDSNSNNNSKDSSPDSVDESSNESSKEKEAMLRAKLDAILNPVDNKTTETYKFYQAHFGEISFMDQTTLNTWLERFDDEIVKDALRRSVGKDDVMTYANRILTIWHQKGLSTMAAIFKNDKLFDANKYGNKKGKSTHKEIIPSWMKS